MNRTASVHSTLQRALALATALCMSAPAGAQHAHGQHQHGNQPQAGHQHGAAYAGMQNRPIKALSEQQVADLRAGKGMSLALPAELNGFPGPSHALELAVPLRLTDDQQARTRALFEQMQREASAAGERLIVAEAELDALFRDRRVTPALLTAAVAKAAQAQGTLRETHLRYHLRMMEVLSTEQVVAYNRMRGY